MNWLSGLLLAMGVAASLTLWWIILVQIPGLARLRYRIQLREIHDDLMDMVISGRVKPSETVDRLLDTIDALIFTARGQTTASFILAGAVSRPDDARARSRSDLFVDDQEILATVPVGERNELLAISGRTHAAMIEHLRRGSPLGWLVTVIMSIIGPRRPSADEAASRVLEVATYTKPATDRRGHHLAAGH